MNESQMTLGVDWMGQDPTGWWMSEKLDGCRAYWDGERLWTRGGNVIPAPAWFTAGLPSGMHLDGELWAGRGEFTRARIAAQAGRLGATMTLEVFDCPTALGTWPERMRVASASLHGGNARLVEFRRCSSRADMDGYFARILAAGGEGVILRSPGVIGYERGRTANLLKVKPI